MSSPAAGKVKGDTGCAQKAEIEVLEGSDTDSEGWLSSTAVSSCRGAGVIDPWSASRPAISKDSFEATFSSVKWTFWGLDGEALFERSSAPSGMPCRSPCFFCLSDPMGIEGGAEPVRLWPFGACNTNTVTRGQCRL